MKKIKATVMSNEKIIIQIINEFRGHRKTVTFHDHKEQIMEWLEKPWRPVSGYS